jgi:hypothetical protein
MHQNVHDEIKKNEQANGTKDSSKSELLTSLPEIGDHDGDELHIDYHKIFLMVS